MQTFLELVMHVTSPKNVCVGGYDLHCQVSLHIHALAHMSCHASHSCCGGQRLMLLVQCGSTLTSLWRTDELQRWQNSYPWMPKDVHCRVSYRERLGTNPLIVIMATQYSHSQKEHIELYKITKFGVNRINFERLTTVQKC